MDDDEAETFPPPDAGEEIADEPDPAFGECDDDDDIETPDDDEPDPDPAD